MCLMKWVSITHSNVDCTFKYHKIASECGICMKRNGHLNVYGYSKNNWFGNISNRKTAMNFDVMLGRNITS